MDSFNAIFSTANSWGTVFALALILGVIVLFIMPWRQHWRCPECGAEFDSRESALGHQAAHGLHKPVQEK